MSSKYNLKSTTKRKPEFRAGKMMRSPHRLGQGRRDDGCEKIHLGVKVCDALGIRYPFWLLPEESYQRRLGSV